jgi:hypothetical protein
MMVETAGRYHSAPCEVPIFRSQWCARPRGRLVLIRPEAATGLIAAIPGSGGRGAPSETRNLGTPDEGVEGLEVLTLTSRSHWTCA